jgi:hypothetical protein
MTETLERPITAASQTRGWRNKWRSLRDGGFYECCPHIGADAGEDYWECPCVPPFGTKAEAEANAVDDIVAQIRIHGCMTDEFLGSFPDPLSEPRRSG